MEVNIKPSVIRSFYEIETELRKYGFKEQDILIMLQDRTKPKMSLTNIRNMYCAIKQFEKDFQKLREKFKE